MRKIYTALGVICLCLFTVFLQAAPGLSNFKSSQFSAPGADTSKPWYFIGNKGQLHDEHGSALNDILFYGLQGNTAVYCRSGKISFVFFRQEGNGSSGDSVLIAPGRWKPLPRMHAARMDMVLEGARSASHIVPNDVQPFLCNFYGGEQGNAWGVQSFAKLVYKDIYRHIDLVLYSRPDGLKYGFIVRPGGRVSDIRIRWEGAATIALNEQGGIFYRNATGEMAESAPVCFTEAGSIAGRFTLRDNIVSFEIGHVPATQTLTIDPELKWGTYFGGNKDDIEIIGRPGISLDRNNNVCIAGATYSTAGIATSGAFQKTFTGTTSGFLARFNTSGTLKWATYVGNNFTGSEVANDSVGNIYLSGETGSDGLATANAHQQHLAGKYDAFLGSFDSLGKIRWGTYLGGSDWDYGLTITCDDSGRVFMGGYTGSKGLATQGTFLQKGHGFLTRFTTTGTRVWYTYTSGFVDRIKTNSKIIAITERDPDTGMASIGTYRPKKDSMNGPDGFGMVSTFTLNGQRNWGTYFNVNLIGNFSASSETDLAIDKNGEIYVGCTIDSMTYPYDSLAASDPYTGGINACIYKFFPHGTLDWLITYGTPGSGYNKGREELYDLALDTCGFVYVSGHATLPTGPMVTEYANANCEDCSFISRFSPSGKLVYGRFTTYGGGSRVKFDKLNNLYYYGVTLKNPDLLKNPYQKYFGGGLNDMFLQKYSTKPMTIEDMRDTTVTCADDQARLGAPAKTGYAYSWSSRPAGFTSSEANPFVTPGVTTMYYRTAYPPEGCQIIDSMKVTVTSPRISAGNNAAICLGDSILIGPPTAVKTVSYSWTSVPSGFISSDPNPFVKPQVTTTYTLQARYANGCTSHSEVTISVNVPPKPDAGTDTTVCPGSAIVLGTNGIPGASYEWSSRPEGFQSADSFISVNPLQTTTYYLKLTSTSTGCSAMDSVRVTVYDVPKPEVSPDQEICEGDSTVISYTPHSGFNYQWTSDPIGLVSNDSLLWVKPVGTTTYYLHQITGIGCEKIAPVIVVVHPRPKAIIGTGKTVCAGENVFLGSQPAAGHTYEWWSKPEGFHSTAANLFMPVQQATTFFLREASEYGCVRTDSVSIGVYPLPEKTMISPAAVICEGNSYQLKYKPLPGYDYEWSSPQTGFISVDSIVTVAPAENTLYILKQTNTGTGCAVFDTVLVSVLSQPDASITGSAERCGIGTETYTASLPNAKLYEWDVSGGMILSGNGTQVIQVRWQSPGEGRVRLRVTNFSGCTDASDFPVDIYPMPRAAFETANGCQDDSIQFIDRSENATDWQWDFGDGSVSAEEEPGHAFTSAGLHQVRLVVTSAKGCRDTTYYDVTVYPKPVLNWAIKPDTGRSFSFGVSNTSYAKYEWDFGDNSQSDRPEGRHSFSADRQYPVSLLVHSDKGCTLRLDTLLAVHVHRVRDSVIVFPNPAKEKVTVRVFLSKDAHVKLSIIDELGRMLATDVISENAKEGIHDYVVDDALAPLAPALYIFIVEINSDTVIRKAIKLDK